MQKRIILIGWIGSICLLVAYFLLSFDYIAKDSILYHLLNLMGGITIGYRVLKDKNYSNFVLEIFFILVALKSIIQIVLK